jgi:acyl-CoA reductase-like NAD-dependent aldehyde dehydrogenase
MIKFIFGLAKTFVFVCGIAAILCVIAENAAYEYVQSVASSRAESADKALADAVDAFLAIPKNQISPVDLGCTNDELAEFYILGFESRGNKATAAQREVVRREVAPRMRTIMARAAAKYVALNPDATDAEIGAVLETEAAAEIQKHTLGAVGLLLR